ncbi:MAG: hypothetical protein AB1485_04150 [Candidatus Thermoplasmatota archaeon]
MVISNPTASRSMRLREAPWLKIQRWHTENEKKRMEQLWNRLYLNPPEKRKKVYESYKPSWMGAKKALSFKERLESLRKKK